jgi:hypothetical protein
LICFLPTSALSLRRTDLSEVVCPVFTRATIAGQPWLCIRRQPDFQSRPEHGKAKPGMKHHFDRGSDSETFNDPGGWNKALYTPDLFAELGEPLPEAVNGYRQAALHFCRIMFCIDEFITTAPDARIGVVAIAVVLGWPSARGLSIGDIAGQLGCSPPTITRACARFRQLANLNSAGGVRFIRPGAGSNGDKPAAVQA